MGGTYVIPPAHYSLYVFEYGTSSIGSYTSLYVITTLLHSPLYEGVPLCPTTTYPRFRTHSITFYISLSVLNQPNQPTCGCILRVSFVCGVRSLGSTRVLTHPSFTHTQVLDFVIILVSIANLVLTGKNYESINGDSLTVSRIHTSGYTSSHIT